MAGRTDEAEGSKQLAGNAGRMYGELKERTHIKQKIHLIAYYQKPEAKIAQCKHSRPPVP